VEKAHEMNNLLIDSDVILDYFLDRNPYSNSATELLKLGKKDLVLRATPLTFANVYYILRKSGSHSKSINALKYLADMVKIIKMNRYSVLNALDSSWKDFEDALQYFSAVQNDLIDVIITRNTKDYKGSILSIMTPDEFLSAKTGFSNA